mmetsp:Transcript_3918/g.5611  ORF Transcript_3918/g.5611 Transcript_3918/m.5611 type:complete len:519 (+) Transcript_3918:196-1752(+)|eukprot:CAMPEP_0184478692 /NCGR_PEP_ID=MMETSP0113_2-20130426/652_1 /TAXON_ID=91329 /ORGANISM="Norrisiella sphaerica, Strain BC52" /LENGTH=518 /DNA_ID=CAMNT_0026856577 /DNA_START=177 /DNA_END=1733 /DNA_ORIENTATION=-
MLSRHIALRGSRHLTRRSLSSVLPVQVGLPEANESIQQVFRHDNIPIPEFKARDNSAGSPNKLHEKKDWSKEEIDTAIKDNCVFAWGPSDPLREACPVIVRGEGCWLYDYEDKKYLDWSAGAVCTNIGNSMPAEIKAAIEEQMSVAPFVYGDLAVTEARAKLCSLLADITPGDLNGFLFASGGAEANEAAIRMARRYTGRYKILSRYRSYHGGTTSTLAMTGDPRTWATDTTITGFAKIPDPFPFSFSWGTDAEEQAKQSLNALHEQILMEGPSSVAAIFMESITGSNGWLLPHPSYMQGVRALCDKYGILMICDEVMCGFGRTGKLFGFQNFPGVIPDMFTFAKGVTGAYMPLSGVAMSDAVFDYFRTNPPSYGSTYSGHPLTVACGYAVVKYVIENDIPARAKSMEATLAEGLSRLVANHKSAKQARVIGLAGGVDLGGLDGSSLMQMHETHPAVGFFKNRLKEEGLITLVRGHHMHCTPPLIISEDEISYGIDILDKCFGDLDEFLEDYEAKQKA